MALSNVQNPDILLFIGRQAKVAAEDIDDLILEVNKNKDRIKSLLAAKNMLTKSIDSIMRRCAEECDVFSDAQMLDYREFSEFYEAETAILVSYITRLRRKMGQIAGTLAKPYADLAALHKGLETIIALQERVIAVLTGMVNATGKTLNILASK